MKSAEENFRHNFTVSLLDGSFFGLGLGLASFTTVIPLFLSTVTDSVKLIGLVTAVHDMGWQLPQLFTAQRVAGLRRYKPMVLLMTLNERIPFLGLALVAWSAASLGITVTLWLTFALLVWQGLGGGLTATAWQSMIGKIVPPRRRGAFFGAQAGAANLSASMGALIAGFLLERLGSPWDYTACFLLAAGAMALSWVALARTREASLPPVAAPTSTAAFWRNLRDILHRDRAFSAFVLARILMAIAGVSQAFFVVYAVRRFGVGAGLAGALTAVFFATQIVANPLMGWLGDHLGHRSALVAGTSAAVVSNALAWWGPSVEWLYVVFFLAGIAKVAFWTIALTMTLDFGSLEERPAYIGLSNSLVGPSTIIAPLVGGWLVDQAGFGSAFLLSIVGGVAALVALRWATVAPVHAHNGAPTASAVVGEDL